MAGPILLRILVTYERGDAHIKFKSICFEAFAWAFRSVTLVQGGLDFGPEAVSDGEAKSSG
jgi:hypothetical protein